VIRCKSENKLKILMDQKIMGVTHPPTSPLTGLLCLCWRD